MRHWMIAFALLAGAGLFVGSTARAQEESDTAEITVEVLETASVEIEDFTITLDTYDGEGLSEDAAYETGTGTTTIAMHHNYDGYATIETEATTVPEDQDLTITVTSIEGIAEDQFPATLVENGSATAGVSFDALRGAYDAEAEVTADGTLRGTAAGNYVFVVTATMIARD